MLAGNWLARRPPWKDFQRFHHAIQPQSGFHPTIRQLIAHVRATVPPAKTLVLIGGASYLRGTGQNPGELWSRELQRRLGDQYAVINYAIDAAGPTAFAAVAAQALQVHYPSLIYVCTGGPFSQDALEGGAPYDYLFWEAWHRGLLPLAEPRAALVRRRAERLARQPEGAARQLAARLDSLTHANDLWNWVSHDLFNPVWTLSLPGMPFLPRRLYRDEEQPDLATLPQRVRADPRLVAQYEEENRNFARAGRVLGPDGKWVDDPALGASIQRHYEGFFAPEMRQRTLVVLVQANRFFMRTLSAEDREGLRRTRELARARISAAGYGVVTVGEDFAPDDFIDAGHFTATGGRKVAALVAAEILRLGLPLPPGAWPSGAVVSPAATLAPAAGLELETSSLELNPAGDELLVRLSVAGPAEPGQFEWKLWLPPGWALREVRSAPGLLQIPPSGTIDLVRVVTEPAGRTAPSVSLALSYPPEVPAVELAAELSVADPAGAALVRGARVRLVPARRPR
jgi:hypothetical protein